MTNREIESKMQALVKTERQITGEILTLVNLAQERKLYLELGFPSLFEWLVKGHHYSESAAYRRIQAARLLQSVPEISEKLDSGEVNLSTLAKAQSAIQACEKKTGEKLSSEIKASLVKKIEWKTQLEAERAILTVLPEAKSVQEKLSPVDADTSKLSTFLPNEVIEELKRVKDLLSHRFPNASFSEIVSHLTKYYLKREDPLKKEPASTAATVPLRKTKNIRAEVRRTVLQKAGGACEWRDPVTKRRCGSRHQVEVDHVRPRALGGGDEIENLRCLCRNHNMMMAERNLGTEKAGNWRRT